MKRWIIAYVLLSLACTRTPVTSAVTIFAASSLTELMTDIAADWTRAGKSVNVQFGASSTLARQIQEGAKVDVFISAAPEWLDPVKPLERFDWLSNRLVCVVRQESGYANLQSLDSLSIANEQVPAGKYARAALTEAGVGLPARTIYGSSVRDVLRNVVEGGASGGIVYATDAASEPKVKVIHVFPQKPPNLRIVYSVGLMRGEGRFFFNGLRDPETFQHAVNRGFLEIR